MILRISTQTVVKEEWARGASNSRFFPKRDVLESPTRSQPVTAAAVTLSASPAPAVFLLSVERFNQAKPRALFYSIVVDK